jgi:dUTP pyrophosphatase
MLVGVKRLNPQANLPKYAHEGLGGDIAADLTSTEKMIIQPGDIVMIPTGIAIECPRGWAMMVHGRSGLFIKEGLLVNTGLIDNPYRGELKILAANIGRVPIRIEVGDRIAQMRFISMQIASYIWAEELSTTTRGAGGFGSTGAIARQ